MSSKSGIFDAAKLRTSTSLEYFLQDLRFAARMLSKNLGFTLLSVLVLALGIGANTSIFSVVNAAMLQPLPYADADRIVQVWHTPPQKQFFGRRQFAVSIANFLDWKSQQHVFEHISLYRFTSLNLASTNQPEAIAGAAVTDGFFSVLGIGSLLGRVFTADEMEPGHDHVIVLSYAIWQSHFGADPTIIGRTVPFNSESYTVIGVMPERFIYPGFARVWVPAALTPKDRATRGNHNSLVIARLKAGIDLGKAQAEMDTISRRLEREYPVENTGWGAVLVPLREQMVGNLRTALLVLLGAVGCVLFIACSNVANLALAKTMTRNKEIAIRSALGATRGRLLQLVLGESLILSLVGGVLGLLLAHYGIRLIVAFFGNRLPPSVDVQLDGAVLAFTFCISVSCGVLAGVLPTVRLMRRDINLQDSLKQGMRDTHADSDSGRTRNLLVTAEVALSIILLVSAGLLIRTLWFLRGIDPGFDPHNVLAIQVPRALGPDSQRIFLENVLERVRAIPGIASAAATSDVPLGAGGAGSWPIQVEGQPPQPLAQQPIVAAEEVTPNYFATLRIPILRGRDFSDADTSESPPVVLVNEAMAKRFWPNQDAIGKRLATTFSSPEKLREVVGIVANTKDRGLELPEPLPTLYVPSAEFPNPGMSLIVRVNGPVSGVVVPVTRAIHDLDQQQPVRVLGPMEEVIAASFAGRRFNMLLLAAFAGMALILTAAGLYGVLSYCVRRRTREIGIRMALGAQIADVLRGVLLEGMRPTLIGVLLGIAGSLLLGRILKSMIYGVKPTDLSTFAAVVAILAVVSLLACIVPAWRATQVEPLKVLRDE